MLRGSSLDPVDMDSWKHTQLCASGSLLHKMACFSGKDESYWQKQP